MRLKEKKLLQKFAATLKKFSAQGAKKVEYGNLHLLQAQYGVVLQLSTLVGRPPSIIPQPDHPRNLWKLRLNS